MCGYRAAAIGAAVVYKRRGYTVALCVWGAATMTDGPLATSASTGDLLCPTGCCLFARPDKTPFTCKGKQICACVCNVHMLLLKLGSHRLAASLYCPALQESLFI